MSLSTTEKEGKIGCPKIKTFLTITSDHVNYFRGPGSSKVMRGRFDC